MQVDLRTQIGCRNDVAPQHERARAQKVGSTTKHTCISLACNYRQETRSNGCCFLVELSMLATLIGDTVVSQEAASAATKMGMNFLDGDCELVASPAA